MLPVLVSKKKKKNSSHHTCCGRGDRSVLFSVHISAFAISLDVSPVCQTNSDLPLLCFNALTPLLAGQRLGRTGRGWGRREAGPQPEPRALQRAAVCRQRLERAGGRRQADSEPGCHTRQVGRARE